MVVILLLLLLFPVSAFATALSDAAAALSPGQWATFTTNFSGPNGDGTNDILGAPIGYITEFANNAGWDPINHKVQFCGSSHHGASGIYGRCMEYTESTNTWQEIAWAPGQCQNTATCGGTTPFNHAYGTNSNNPKNGNHYFMHYGDSNVRRFNAGSRTWDTLTPSIPSTASTCCRVAQWFAAMNALIVFDMDWGIWKVTEGAGTSVTWTCIGNSGSAGGAGCSGPNLTPGTSNDTQINGAYSMKKKVMVVCGSGTSCYRINAQGQVAALATAPISTSMQIAVFAEEPVSGNFIVINGTTTYMLNPDGGGSWSSVSTTVPSDLHADDGAVAAAISTYGVIMYPTSQGVGSTKIYLYKPAASTLAGQDFTLRCATADVLRCFGFDTSADLGTTGPSAIGANFGMFNNNNLPCTTATCPQIDTTQAASGGGSMLFTIPSQSGAGQSGQWFTNFTTDLSVLFGQNSDFYIQWRQRFSPELLNTVYTAIGGGNAGGWKLAITGQGDTPGNTSQSCTTADVVVQNTNQRKFVQGYQSCSTQGGLGHIAYWPFEDSNLVAGDIAFQNAMPAPYCLYSQGPNYFPPNGNCFPLYSNEWMTIQIHVHPGTLVNDGSGAGTYVYQNSHVDYWIAREGQPSQKIINFGPFSINADVLPGEQWGKVWLLPYHTNKDPTQVHPTAYTWYDELVISRTQISDPGFPSAPVTPPPTTSVRVSRSRATY